MTTSIADSFVVRRRKDGFIDLDFYRRRAEQEHDAYMRELFSNGVPLPALSPRMKRNLTMFAAALAVATGAFWAVILTSPPPTAAAQPEASSVPVFEMMRNAPLDLPQLHADAH